LDEINLPNVLALKPTKVSHSIKGKYSN